MADDQPRSRERTHPGHDRRSARRDRVPARRDGQATVRRARAWTRTSRSCSATWSRSTRASRSRPGGPRASPTRASATGTFVNGEKVEGEHPLQRRRPDLPRPARARRAARSSWCGSPPAPQPGRHAGAGDLAGRAGDGFGPGRARPLGSGRGAIARRSAWRRVQPRGRPGALGAGSPRPLFSAPPPAPPPDAPTVAPRPPAFAGVHSTAVAGATARTDAAPGRSGRRRRRPGRTTAACGTAPVPPPPAAATASAPGRAPRPRRAPGPSTDSELPSIPVAERPARRVGTRRVPGRCARAGPSPLVARPPAKGRPRRGAAGCSRSRRCRCRSRAAALVGRRRCSGGSSWTLLRTTPPQLASATAAARRGRARPSPSPGRTSRRTPPATPCSSAPCAARSRRRATTELKVIVPGRRQVAQVPVVVETKGGRSTPLSVTVTARAREVTALEPDVAMPGQTVLRPRRGPRGPELAVRDRRAAGAVGRGVGRGRACGRAGARAAGGLEDLRRRAGRREPARTFDLLDRPAAARHGGRPRDAARWATASCIRGRGFAPEPRAATRSPSAASPRSSSRRAATELDRRAAARAGDDVQPELPVVVTADGRASSSSASFALTRGATSGFRARASSRRRSPSTRATASPSSRPSSGPCSLLGGPAEAALDRGARGRRLAAALNALVAGARPRPPGVRAARAARALASAVVGRGAARSSRRPPRTSRRTRGRGRPAGRRPARRRLGRSRATGRPSCRTTSASSCTGSARSRCVALSPRGKVLNDIYGEAEPRARPAGRGVPTSLVLPTHARPWRRACGDGARRLDRGAARGGRGRGPLGRDDRGPRPRRPAVPGAAAPPTAGGSRARSPPAAGSIEMHSAAPRHRLRPRQRALHRRPAGRTACRFKGTLDGNNVSGTIERDGPEAAVPLHAAVRGVSVGRRVRTGLERLLDRPGAVRGLRAGLVVNPSSITPDLVHASVALAGARGVRLVALFGPEHGIAADAQDLVEVGHSRDRATGLPVLQPLRRDPRAHARRCCAGVDAMVVRRAGRGLALLHVRLHDAPRDARPARARASASSCSTARTRSAARSSTATCSTPRTAPSSACTRSRCATA